MVRDEACETYVPVMYILMSCKSTECYWYALEGLIAASKWKLEPFSVTFDFEKASHKAVRHQFPNCQLNGCLFHLKQAWRRFMITKLMMRDELVSMFMTKNILDVLTIIPRDEIKKKGIAFVRSILDKECKDKEEEKQMDKFWAYFRKEWCSSDEFIATWNICDEDEAYFDLANRTNNALERYNRRMNDLFSTPHPSLLEFVTTIEKESRYQVQRLDNIRYRHEIPPENMPLTLDEVPLIYINFTYDPKKKNYFTR